MLSSSVKKRIKNRLDRVLVDRGLADSREKAQALILAGAVEVDGEPATKAGRPVEDDAVVRILEEKAGTALRYVSRGGLKLEAAIEHFGLEIGGKVAVDIGASTGGFTDCLLQHGAARVYAVDVGYGQLAWTLRRDARVHVIERSNIRTLPTGRIPESADLATIDVSFISLKIILPVVKGWMPIDEEVRRGSVIALVKPQFEAGRQQVGRGKGVIRDPLVHRQVLLDVLGSASQASFATRGLLRSPLTGPKGNTEFLAWLELAGKQEMPIEEQVDLVLSGEIKQGETSPLTPAH